MQISLVLRNLTLLLLLSVVVTQGMAHLYSPQAFVFLIQRYLGVDAAALFGFLRSLFGQFFVIYLLHIVVWLNST